MTRKQIFISLAAVIVCVLAVLLISYGPMLWHEFLALHGLG